MKAGQIQIGLRGTEMLNKKLMKKAKCVGISKNALVLTLIRMGLEAWERGVISPMKL
jgi:hypothetical protein